MAQSKTYGDHNKKSLLPISSKLAKYYIWLGIMAAIIVLVTLIDL